jgi:hypothetical protein
MNNLSIQEKLKIGTIEITVQDEKGYVITASNCAHIESLLRRAKEADGVYSLWTFIDDVLKISTAIFLLTLSWIIPAYVDEGFKLPQWSLNFLWILCGSCLIVIPLFYFKKRKKNKEKTLIQKSYIDEVLELIENIKEIP